MTPQELKNSILQLAIQGKLVEQRPEEGTAAELYNKLKKYHVSLIKSKDELDYSSMDLDLPESWKMVELNQLFKFVDYRGMTPSKISEGIFLITASNIKMGYMDYSRKEYISYEEYENRKSRGITQKGDLLFTTEAPMGNVALCDLNVCSCGQRIITFQYYEENTVIPSLFMYFILSPQFQKQLLNNCTGTTAKGIKADKLKHFLIPLPPLAEQKRIVAKIEELLPLIDRYAAAWSRLEDFNKRFPNDMQKSILQMAIQGKLVEQRPEEGTAEELYKQIQSEKQSLIKAGKLKKEKPLPPITDDEKPFDIPESWKWVRLASITDMLSGFAFKSEEFKNSGKYRLLRGINLGVNKIRWNETVYVDTISDQLEDYKLKKGDVLLGLDRPWISEGTRVAIFNDSEETYLVQRVLRIRELDGFINSYISLILNSSLMNNTLAGETTGISVPHISPNQVGMIAVPLPPLAEQKRIVSKIEELLPPIRHYELSWSHLKKA